MQPRNGFIPKPGFFGFVGESRPSSRRYPLKGTMSRAVRPNAGFFFFRARANGSFCKSGSAGHARELGFPVMSFFNGVVF